MSLFLLDLRFAQLFAVLEFFAVIVLDNVCILAILVLKFYTAPNVLELFFSFSSLSVELLSGLVVASSVLEG